VLFLVHRAGRVPETKCGQRRLGCMGRHAASATCAIMPGAVCEYLHVSEFVCVCTRGWVIRFLRILSLPIFNE